MLASQSIDQRCPCGSGKPFAFCCKPFVEFQKPAPTAELLMRSRYTAFVLGAIDYLVDTTTQEKRELIDREIIAEQVQCTNWTGLEIIQKSGGDKDDGSGTVEFKASFETGEERCILHEHSNFRFENGHWFYVDGDVSILPAE